MAAALADLRPYLHHDRVLFMRGTPTRRDTLIALATATTAELPPVNRAIFLKAVFDREEMTSTALGNGIAIPHARLGDIPACLITLGLCPAGVDFAARDGQRVRFLAMIAAREHDRAEHLRVLAAVATRLNDAQRRERLMAATTADEALELFAG